MMKKSFVSLLAGLILLPSAGLAREVAGVNVPEFAKVGDAALVLNGAGIRSKFFIKVYVGALYLPTMQHEVAPILAADAPTAVHMHVLHSEVEAEKLVKAWNEGFAANLEPAALEALKPRIERFNALFRTVRRGDVVRLEYVPGRGTAVAFNAEERGVIEGADFRAALLRVWLGEKPADADLKQGMLGR